jgi:hypothetical protein
VRARKGGKRAHKIQADALNDDINVTAICDVHTSHNPPHPNPYTKLFLPCLSYFDFHEASCLARNEGTDRGRVSSLHIDFLIPSEQSICNICNTQLAIYLRIIPGKMLNQPVCSPFYNSCNLKKNESRKGLLLTFKVQWLLYVPPCLTFTNSTFCPLSVFMCFVCISEQTAMISLYNIN